MAKNGNGWSPDKMRELEIGAELLVRNEGTHESSYCFVVYNEMVEALLKEIYGRGGLCLKVFKRPLGEQRPEGFGWGQVPFPETARVQNLFAWYGLAPRVIDLVMVEGRVAQVVEFVSGEWESKFAELEAVEGLTTVAEATRLHNIIRATNLEGLAGLKTVAERYRIKAKKVNWDLNERNWVGGKFVDFSGLYFEDPDAYKRDLVRRAHTRRDKYIGVAYQGVEELGIKGTRDMSHRLEVMRLDRLDFEGKTVLDLGCNLGAFSRYAFERGARRVVGVDRIAQLAHEVSNLLGYWQVLFIEARLPGDLGRVVDAAEIKRFDIVFATAVTNHMQGFGQWMADLCGGTMIFEGHGKIPGQEYEADLRAAFERVKFLGETSDNYVRSVFRAERN